MADSGIVRSLCNTDKFLLLEGYEIGLNEETLRQIKKRLYKEKPLKVYEKTKKIISIN